MDKQNQRKRTSKKKKFRGGVFFFFLMSSSLDPEWCRESDIETFLGKIRNIVKRVEGHERIPYLDLGSNFSKHLINMKARFKYHEKLAGGFVKSDKFKEGVKNDKSLQKSIQYIDTQTKRISKKMKKELSGEYIDKNGKEKKEKKYVWKNYEIQLEKQKKKLVDGGKKKKLIN